MMVFDLDSWHEVLATLRKNRLRTALTGLGVFLGIVILMVMVAFNQSLEAGVLKKMSGFATNAVWVWGQRTSQPYAGLPTNRPIQLDTGDLAALSHVAGIEVLAPETQIGGYENGAVVTYGGKRGAFQVIGTSPEVGIIDQPQMRAGRFLDDLDISERRKVAVVGAGVIAQLFPRGDQPIGQELQINGVFVEIVGVFETRAQGEERDRKLNTVYVPYTTFQRAFHTGERIGWFGLTVRPDASAEDLETTVRALLGQRHKVAPTDDQALGSWNNGKQFGKMQRLFVVMNLVMWFAGIMTLAAGVIGVVNIMLISVRERTKEIGVRKALGATPVAVVRMIVSEAVVLTVLAGYLGIVAGVGAIELWTRAIPLLGDKAPFGPPAVGLGLAAAAGAVIILFGALAGVIPASHAARIQPIEALRTE
jgi:putative ABC transport system permease protein